MVSDQYPQTPMEALGDKLKISCHSCGARYLVPAERVRGRRFRVVCRHCEGIIVARCDKGSFTVMPASGGVVASSPDALRLDSSELDEEDAPTAAATRSSGGWYMGISGQPHGPFGRPEVESYLSLGKVGPRTWAWRVGEPSWRRLSEIDEFCDWFLADEMTHVCLKDGGRWASSGRQAAFARGRAVPKGVSSESAAGSPDLARTPDRALTQTEAAATSLAHKITSEAAALSSTLGLSEAGDKQVEEVEEAAAEAATGLLPHVERWRRRTELGLGGDHPGKLSDEAWEEVTASGVHDKRPESARSWVVGSPSEDRQVWSAHLRFKKTLPLAGASSVFDSGLGPLADGPRPVVRSEADAGEERVSEEEGLSGAKLSTELLDLIPPKMTIRPGQTMAPAQISFAPPLPDRGAALVAAGRSLLLRPKQRFWTTGKILAAALIGTAALIGMTVPLVAFFARPPGESNKDVVEEMTPQPRPRRSGAMTMGQGVGPSKAVGKARVDDGGDKGRRRPSSSDRRARRPDAKSAMDESASRQSKARRRSNSRRRAARRGASPNNRKQVVAVATPQARASEPQADDPTVVNVGEAPAAGAVPNTESADQAASPDADAILAAGAVRQRSTANLPKTLSKARIKRTMSRFRSVVQACFDKHQNPGVLKLEVTVQPYGRAVGGALGPLAKTATAACALQALPRLRFPRFAGEPVTFTYPYVLK